MKQHLHLKPLQPSLQHLYKTALFVMLLFVWMTPFAQATPADTIVKGQASRLPVEELEAQWKQLSREYSSYFPNQRAPGFMELVTENGSPYGFQSIVSALFKMLLHEILINGKLLASIVILTIFSMILETLQSAFERNAVSKVGYAISYMVLLLIAINSFTVAIGYARTAIAGMIDFMLAMIPLMLTLLASMGDIATVSVLHPLIVFMIHTVGSLIQVLVFPLLFFSALLHIVSSISDKYKVTQLANLLRNVGVAALGVMVAIFLGVISVQGGTAAVADGVTIRTAKYITGNFVPVVGKLFTDASDTVIGASLLIKNAVGLAGVVVVVFLCAFPALKIMALALIYNFSAAVLQPLGSNPIVSCLQTIGKSMIFVFAALAAVGLMFFMAITIMITAGNVSVMMR